MHRAAAQLDDPDLGRHPRPERRLLEDQRQRPSAQRGAAPAGFPALLERRRHLEQVLRALAAQVRRREEVAHWASARSSVARARSQSRSSTISGGAIRTTFSPALRMSTPVSRHACTIGPAATDSSAPMSRPLPRTARMTGRVVAMRRRPSIKYRPIRAARSGIFSSRTVVKLAMATAVTNGLPPNVVPWVPGVRTLPASRVASVAPMGRPFASAMARRSLYGTCLKPGTSGSKPWWYFGWPVAVTVAIVRPWNELWVAMISYRSVEKRSLAYLRAILIAASLASAPELEK